MHGISIGGNVEQSILITGDGNVVNLGGGAAQTAETEQPPSVRALVAVAAPVANARGTAPPENAPLNIWREWRLVAGAFPQDAPWEVVRLAPTTAKSLDRALHYAARQEAPFHILHFVGHGYPQGLIIEDRLGRERELDLEALTASLDGAGVELLLLNACQTIELATALVERGVVKAAIATRHSVPDSTAITFAEHLYRGLARGEKLASAFREASRAAKAEAIYHLTGDGDLRFPVGEGRFRLRPDPLPFHGLDRRLAERFVGRWEPMLRLGRWLLEADDPLFAVHGVGGIGKTSLVTMAALHYAPAANFHAVIFERVAYAHYRPSNLLNRLFTALRIKPTLMPDERSAAAEAARLLSERRYLLILDNLETLSPAATAQLAELVRQIDTRNGTRVLMTLRPREKDPLTEMIPGRDRLQLAQMPREEAIGLLWKRLNAELDASTLHKRLLEMRRAFSSAPMPRLHLRLPVWVEREGFLPALNGVAELAFDHPAIIHLLARQLPDYHWAAIEHRLRRLRGNLGEKVEQFVGTMVADLRTRSPRSADLLCVLLPFVGHAPAWALPILLEGRSTPPPLRLAEDGFTALEEEDDEAIAFRDEIIQPALRSGLLLREEAGPHTFYRLEPFVHHYLTQRACGDAATRHAMRLRHARLFAALLPAVEEALKADLISMADPPEGENLAAALETLAGEEAEGATLLEGVTSALNLLSLTTGIGTAEQRLHWLEAAEGAARRLDRPQALANVLKAQGDVLAFLDRRDEALARYEAALALYRAVGARLGEANVLKAQGAVLAFQKRNDEALARYEKALALYRAVGDRLGEANVLRGVGRIALANALEAGDAAMLGQAKAAFDAAVTMHHAIGDGYSEAGDRFYRADALLLLGEVEAALEDLRFAEAVFRRLGLPYADAVAQKRQAIEAWLHAQGEG